MTIGMADFVAQPAGEPHAVLALQLEIQHNEIHDFCAEQHLHRVAVGDGADAQLVLPEIVGTRSRIVGSSSTTSTWGNAA